MPSVEFVYAPMDDARRAALLFRGDLLVFRNLAAMARLIAFADGLIRDAFGPLDPETAQFHLDPEGCLARVDALQKTYRRSKKAKRLCAAVLQETGVDPALTFWDWLYLRVLPHGAESGDSRACRLAFHRDSWASNLYQQANWWAPLYPVTLARTIAFRLDYWSTPIANTSADWDLEELRAHKSRGQDYPRLPLPREPVDMEPALRIVIEPGDVLCFSGAHLHAGVPNVTGVARFSTEFRTVNIDDLREGRGAPNIDGKAPRVALDWFSRIADGAKLDAVIEREKVGGSEPSLGPG